MLFFISYSVKQPMPRVHITVNADRTTPNWLCATAHWAGHILIWNQDTCWSSLDSCPCHCVLDLSSVLSSHLLIINDVQSRIHLLVLFTYCTAEVSWRRTQEGGQGPFEEPARWYNNFHYHFEFANNNIGRDKMTNLAGMTRKCWQG